MTISPVQPDAMFSPDTMGRTATLRDELEQRLAALGTYGRDAVIEQLVDFLRFPELLARTAVIVGMPQTGKTRLLHNLATLLRNQQLPLAEANCRPSDQHFACGVLSAIIYQFLTTYAHDDLQQRFEAERMAYPWLSGLFPLFGDAETARPLSEDPVELRRGLEQLLRSLICTGSHIVVLHNVHLVDDATLTVLTTVQEATGHGLRIIAGTDPENGEVPARLRGLAHHAFTTTLRPFTKEQVCAYLQEIMPDIAQDELVNALYAQTQGLPLAIEMVLRSWAESGVLGYQDRRWLYHAERGAASSQSHLSPDDQRRLAIAAVVCPQPVDILCRLWSTTAEDALRTVAQGRALGMLAPAEADHPEQVDLIDQEHADALLGKMPPEERIAIHAEVAGLVEAAYGHEIGDVAQELVYHFRQAGKLEQANRYLQYLQLAASTLTPILVAPQTAPIGGIESWNIPPAAPIDSESLDTIINAALAIRLAGVQYRLYPPTSDMARTAVRQAMVALEALFATRQSLIITFDGHTVAFDGQIIQRRDLQVSIKDYSQWMAEGNIRAIGITALVREYELSRFLHALATYEPKEAKATLLDKVVLLNLMNIKLLTRSFQPDLLQTQSPLSGIASPVNAGMPGASSVTDGDGNAGDSDTLGYSAARHNIPAVIGPGVLPSDPGTETVPTMTDPSRLDDETWDRLSDIIHETHPQTRRAMMNNLVHWLDEADHQLKPELVERLDDLLIDRLAQEEDRQVMQETITAVETRLLRVIDAHDWEGMIALLHPFIQRLHQHPPVEIERQLTTVLERIGEQTAMRGLLGQQIDTDAEMNRVQQVVEILGEYVLRPLVHALKATTVMQERSALMQLLREFGGGQQSLLIAELRAENPWYVHRNLLQVLADNGTDEALAPIGEKMNHPDARVRAEAVVAAARIARERAGAYLLQGLEDVNHTVQARAASLVSVCPEPRILEILLRMLQSRIGGDEPESVQLNACLGLGYFAQDSARDALVQILYPSLFSPFRKKSESIRSAAVTALEQHLPHHAAEAAIKRATADRSQLVRQAAQRAWQLYLLSRKTESTA